MRELQGGPVPVTGALAADDPIFEGLGFQLAEPVQVDGALQPTADGDYLWRGHVQGRVAGECRRCLGGVLLDVDDDVDVLFSADPDLADDPGVYPLSPEADVVDITLAVREELALRVSAFPLCRPDCKGLCAKCGADLNAGACDCATGPNH